MNNTTNTIYKFNNIASKIDPRPNNNKVKSAQSRLVDSNSELRGRAYDHPVHYKQPNFDKLSNSNPVFTGQKRIVVAHIMWVRGVIWQGIGGKSLMRLTRRTICMLTAPRVQTSINCAITSSYQSAACTSEIARCYLI